MNHLNVKKLGFAFGLTGTLLYLGCIVVMMTSGKEGSIAFFNSLLHGLDTTNIIRMDVSALEAFFGIIQTFILWWLIGACIAAIYNAQLKIGKKVT